jgi:hypothetical protein
MKKMGLEIWKMWRERERKLGRKEKERRRWGWKRRGGGRGKVGEGRARDKEEEGGGREGGEEGEEGEERKRERGRERGRRERGGEGGSEGGRRGGYIYIYIYIYIFRSINHLYYIYTYACVYFRSIDINFLVKAKSQRDIKRRGGEGETERGNGGMGEDCIVFCSGADTRAPVSVFVWKWVYCTCWFLL